jgi:glucose-6-phosphate dehydrogenase assembly protein OpcA
MGATDNRIFPLAEPAEVDIRRIEQELDELWRRAAEHEQGAVMRAAAFTLIYAMRDLPDGGAASQMLVSLTESHPCRMLLLRLNDTADQPAQQAWVTSFCHRPSADAPPVCNDFITMDYHATDPALVASAVMSVLLPGLPSVLIWDSSLSVQDPLLELIGRRMKRVIVSAIPPCGPASALAEFFRIEARLGERPVVTDLAESLLRPWQVEIARLFDEPAGAARAINEIRFLYDEAKIPADLLLLGAWMSSALSWERPRIVLQGTHPTILFEGGRSLVFCRDALRQGGPAVIFRGRPDDAAAGITSEEPPGDNRLQSLILQELTIWERSPLREVQMRRARAWLNELLFA